MEKIKTIKVGLIGLQSDCQYQYAEEFLNNPSAKVAHYLRNRNKSVLNGNQKAGNTTELLGCSFEIAIEHIEKQFKPGMTWDNHGEWHIDHCKACAKFDLTDLDEQKKCFHYTNLQPLWAHENLSKGCK